MTSNETYTVFKFALILLVVVLCTSFGVGYWRAWEDFKRIAVQAGAIEYYLDDENNREWRWSNKPEVAE
jgi:hypothetical protein